MIIIGLSGKKLAGKDTVADIIKDTLKERHDVHIVGFGDALKDEVSRACGVSRHFIDNNKSNFRLIMQGWGTDFKRLLVKDDYWIEKLAERVAWMPSDSVVIVKDIRFPNEASFIKECGGCLIRIDRKTESWDKHLSETELDNYVFDRRIDNNGTMEDLRLKTKQILEDLKVQ